MTALLVAEMCQNHGGQRSILQRMIHAAAEAGADYAKLQSIRTRELTKRLRFEEPSAAEARSSIVRPYGKEFDRLTELELTRDDEQWFVIECQRAGIRSMSTPFTRSALREIGGDGFDAVKIASYDCKSYPMLRDLSTWWSTVFLSTGAMTEAEVRRAVREVGDVELYLLHCVTLYPTPLEESKLGRLRKLRSMCRRVGLSDHSSPELSGLVATKVALAVGADVIERHFTVREPGATRDGPVSVDAKGLAEIRRFADLTPGERVSELDDLCPGWERLLDDRPFAPSVAELRNRDYYAGRFASWVGERQVFNWEDVDLDVEAWVAAQLSGGQDAAE
jgi:N,N'-diacetyllegionaminate synthase